MEKVAIHVRCNAAGAIRRETRNGREVIVAPSFTLRSGIIMNRIKYEHDEIEKSYKGLELTPAPLGHPIINGKFVSALHPQGLAQSYVFAWNENVRRDGDRIALDKVIDVARAKESEGGRTVLDAINKGEPIHTSTGLLCNLEKTEAADHDFLARDMVWDHDAILLNEEGAAKPEDGTGIFVNSATSGGEEIRTVNSAMEDADRDLTWAVESVARALEKRAQAPFLERLKATISEAFANLNAKEPIMSEENQTEGLEAKVNSLADSLSNFETNVSKLVADAVANAVKPLTDNLTEMKANQDAKDKAELDGLIEKIVKANIMDEDTAKELTLNAARKLAEKAKPGKAAALNGAPGGANDDDEFADVDLNANMEAK